MFSDIVAYTSLMGKDEEGAFKLLRKNSSLHKTIIKKYKGEFIKEIGDGILASFALSTDAVRCSIAIQKAILKEDYQLRIGLHEGEMVFKHGDAWGDGVNVASRLQELSDEGGIIISGAVYKDVKNKAGIRTEFIAEEKLKNVDDAIDIYKVLYDVDAGSEVDIIEESFPVKSKNRLLYILLAAALFLVIIGSFWLWPKIIKKPATVLEKSIAVLPLDYLSEDQNKQYLADGVMDAITGHLSKIEGLRVTPRTSVEQYRETTKTASVIGEELDVSYLIEGSFLMVENQVRLTIQLVIAKEEDHVLYKEYDKDWSEIFDVQSEVAQAIAKEVEVMITPDVKKRIEMIPTENIEAYNLYLQGRHFWIQEGRDNFDKSIEYYKRALELDPDFALAYSGMAVTYNSYAWFGYLPWSDVLPQMEKAVMKALEIDNTLGEAHAELANVRLVNDWEWPGSEREFKRALELNPNSARAHNQYAWLLSVVGRHDEAIEQSKRAHELDPLSLNIWVELGRRYYFNRDYDKAIEEYRKVLELFPDSWYARSELALALSQKGLHNEAIEEYSKTEFEPTYHWHLGYIYGVAGKQEKAREILNYYLELSKKGFMWPTNIVFIYIGLGEKDKAFEWLEKSYEQRGSWLIHLKVDPMFDSLRSDPRFQDLLEKMNFPD
jgi:TolB-like protein/Tfp pilus assembly protein PilF